MSFLKNLFGQRPDQGKTAFLTQSRRAAEKEFNHVRCRLAVAGQGWHGLTRIIRTGFCPQTTQNDAERGVWHIFSSFRVFRVFRGKTFLLILPKELEQKETKATKRKGHP
jgi:hypothetical protein